MTHCACDQPAVGFPPELINLREMNRVVRHRLRNLCAGMRMALDKIAADTAGQMPAIGTKCQVMTEELERLQTFTGRLDLIFDRLPEPAPLSLFDLIIGARFHFGERFPFCQLQLEGPQRDITLPHGTWLQIVLRELLDNAGDAAGDEGRVRLDWRTDGDFELTLRNSCEDPPPIAPVLPPRPFVGARGRHDSLGLAIVHRVVEAMDGTFALDFGTGDEVTAIVKLPAEGVV